MIAGMLLRSTLETLSFKFISIPALWQLMGADGQLWMSTLETVSFKIRGCLHDFGDFDWSMFAALETFNA